MSFGIRYAFPDFTRKAAVCFTIRIPSPSDRMPENTSGWPPTTGRPVNNGLLAVTIVCEDGTLADCLSTAMFVLGPQAALNYWRTYGGFEMLLVKADGHVVLTNGLYGQFTTNGDSYVVDYAS